MMHREVILFLVVIVLVLPAGAAGDRNDLNFHSDADYVPVIYITDTGEYTSSLTFIPLNKAQPYVKADGPEGWAGNDVIILNALDSGVLQYLNENEVTYEYGGGGGGSGYSAGVRGSEKCCAVPEPGEGDLLSLLQDMMVSVMDLGMFLNNPPYYLVDLNQKPVETMDFSPANNFVSSGSTNHHFQLYVPKEKRHLWVDLNWTGPEMGYQLTIYPPDTVIGPFEDAADGKMNQRIYLDISASPHLSPGMWYYTVTNLNGGYSNFNFTNYY
ncbi:hypothetical protein L1S32_09655 [Methanogenium sp. S4BF]|uniref:hypothetical protein n=1 Tax=Methanogenium sp. S4BF TaxID=1789226 RepID=UPI002417183F|nr:hypothetical protein [Methanogenium sp. S4BF]WFN34106.1 hypothetical protein L1S32_09655 [Methanogenium sp. S4BF]